MMQQKQKILNLVIVKQYFAVCFNFPVSLIDNIFMLDTKKVFFLILGACACIELEQYNDAIDWCKEGLTVSLAVFLL